MHLHIARFVLHCTYGGRLRFRREARYTTAINKKIDLKHPQELTDIVGGIVAADFVEGETGLPPKLWTPQV